MRNKFSRTTEASRTLTSKEERLLELVANGHANHMIANMIGLKNSQVVRNYLRKIYDKIGMWNRLEAAMWYLRNKENRTYWDRTHAYQTRRHR